MKIKANHQQIKKTSNIKSFVLVSVILAFIFVFGSLFSVSAVSGTPSLTETNIVIQSGGTYSLHYSVPTGYTVSFSSNKPAVATVTSAGKVTAVSDGYALITMFYFYNGSMMGSVSCDAYVGSERYIFSRTMEKRSPIQAAQP